MQEKTLSNESLSLMDRYFRAANYLSVAQLYLKENPLLQRKLSFQDIKSKLVGHWGTVPGQNFLYVHLNRVIKKYDLNMMYICGPGHGGQALVSNTYLEGSYTEFYPDITEDLEGLKKLCKQFSFPSGIGSHATPETPGSINEGGELGYSLLHAFGAVFDNPDLIATCMIGDGEAETGPLATSWHSNKFLNPITDGAVLPVLHLNGYKISNPTVLSRISDIELDAFLRGCGWEPFYVQGEEPMLLHEDMATVMDTVILKIKEIQKKARETKKIVRPMWPMIVLRTPKGWTGPKEIDGKRIEGSFRAHQIPVEVTEDHPESLKRLEEWLLSYKPKDLFLENGQLMPELKALAPEGNRRMGCNPHTNGGNLLRPLKLPDFKKFGLSIDFPGNVIAQDMLELGNFIKAILSENIENNHFRIFGPDEALSNRLMKVFDVTNRKWMATTKTNDEFLATNGLVMDSFLSEHACEGWLEGYLLTGRHGFIHSYEAFIRVIDSMVSQHAKWLKMAEHISWRKEIASLNILLTSHVWQQDHNGYTHQDPGFLNHIITKKANIVRIYLPPDANTLISCFNHIMGTKNYINVLVASKHPKPQWLTMDEASKHCAKGIGIWGFASNDYGYIPDLVIATCGDMATLEGLAAVSILREFIPEIKIRFVNVVDLMKLQSDTLHPHGLSDHDYDMIFTKNKPIVFAFHGYANLIHELTYRRHNSHLHVRGYNEEGSITTPFDMRVLNEVDRYHLVMLALKHLTDFEDKSSYLLEYCKNMLVKHTEYIKEHGVDMPEVSQWTWESFAKNKKAIMK
ncbi:MAG: phosphoketolase family protein [Bacilli bacterium]|jgi:xylulose-5-phosphate/fructose-6-phosphate phosphoketolase|nr:phosphoketolase family protein [Bacilli bacterium]